MDEEQLWCEVAIAICKSSNASNVKAAIQWADVIVEEYKKKYP